MKAYGSKRISLWVISGGISIGIGFFVVYPQILVRLPSTISRFIFAALAGFCFIAGIGIVEIASWLIAKTFGKAPSRIDPPGMSTAGRSGDRYRQSASTNIRLPSGPSLPTEKPISQVSGKRHPEQPIFASPIVGSRQRLGWYFAGAIAILTLLGLVGFAVLRRNRSLSAPQPNANVVTQKQASADDLVKAIERKPIELRTALNAYANLSEDIHRILSQGLEKRHIGGAVAVATTNWQWNGDQKFDLPTKLGFERISNDDALVNQVLRGEAAIKDIAIAKAAEKRYLVTIHVINLTRDFLKSRIDKGQLVEMEDGKNSIVSDQNEQIAHTSIPQTVAASDEKRDGVYVIPPSSEGTIEFIAYCVNENLAVPKGSANLAIYKLGNTNFSSPGQLHANRRSLSAT